MGAGPSISSKFFHCRFPSGCFFFLWLICFASLLNGWSRCRWWSLALLQQSYRASGAGRNPHHAPQTMQHPALSSPISSSDRFSMRLVLPVIQHHFIQGIVMNKNHDKYTSFSTSFLHFIPVVAPPSSLLKPHLLPPGQAAVHHLITLTIVLAHPLAKPASQITVCSIRPPHFARMANTFLGVFRFSFDLPHFKRKSSVFTSFHVHRRAEHLRA